MLTLNGKLAVNGCIASPTSLYVWDMEGDVKRRYTVKNIKTGESQEFIGGEEAREKALELEDKWYAQGVEYKSEPVEVCPKGGIK